ncbi:TolC family outer membrane protein [Massilia forsythiae]|uniref:TolC family outer membrane protein n=1 Tax=Massilia forsythiae TaxID=2728020 RepID=A0A7Z2VXM1_9BURK|nr:TolC family outer membrane protein [Massilia forsythiae]QJE00712.1 TolC family outer membrane protein [Massilia forsythiae]
MANRNRCVRGGALRRAALALAAGAVALAAGQAGAVTLQQAYQAALKNDPTYRVSFYDKEAAKENAIIGRSYLLPSVSGSYSSSRNVADVDALQSLGGGLYGRTLTHPHYISRSSIVQLRQPILNLDGVARYRQGKVQARQGEAAFEAGTDEVAVRVVSAYMDALFAEDQIALSRVSRDMYREMMKVNDRLFEKGEGTKTDTLETQARLDLAEAQLVEAQDNAVAARETLAGIIGMDPGNLDKLGNGFRPLTITPGTFEEWEKIALAKNPALAAGRLAVENARLDIDRNRAGHYPRVDFVAAYSKGDAESINTYTQNTVNRTIGVQVNIPIYQGGAISATTRQAAATYGRAQSDLDARTNQVLVELRKAHSLVQSSVRKISALEKAVGSGKLLMTATEQSIKGGVRINLDLLNAQQQLYTSQRDLAQARYSYLIGLLRLRAAAGTLDDGSVREVAAFLR